MAGFQYLISSQNTARKAVDVGFTGNVDEDAAWS